jgi:hypothetical protein
MALRKWGSQTMSQSKMTRNWPVVLRGAPSLLDSLPRMALFRLPALAWCGTPGIFSRAMYLIVTCTERGGRIRGV